MKQAVTISDKARARQRGGALVEFAITVPLLMMMFIGMVEFGYYFYVANSVTGAAREGARQCTLVSLGACGNCNPTAAVSYMAAIGLDEYTSATATCATTAGTFMYTVAVTANFPTLTGYMTTLGVMPESNIEGNTLARSVAIMRGQ